MSKNIFQEIRESESSEEQQIQIFSAPEIKAELKKIDPNSFKISCHAISDIMAGSVGLTEVQSGRFSELAERAAGVGKALTDNMVKELAELKRKRDNPELPQGAKTYLKKWLKKKLFDRNENWKSLVIDKGLACEQFGIELVEKVYGLTGVLKNEQHFSTSFIQGTPDILHENSVRDIKNSWDLFTFPMFDDKAPKPEYEDQLQGYMIITGYRKAFLDYTLIDTPTPIRDLDLKKLYFQSGGKAEDWTPKDYEFMYPNYTFQDIPAEKRVKSFEVIYDPFYEAKINERVVMCRDYIKKILSA